VSPSNLSKLILTFVIAYNLCYVPQHAKLIEKTELISIRFDWWSIRKCRG